MNVAAASSTVGLNEAIDRYHDVLTAYVDRGGEDHLALLDRMVERGAVFAGRARGVLTRLSATTGCNVHTGAGTVPTFILEDTPSTG